MLEHFSLITSRNGRRQTSAPASLTAIVRVEQLEERVMLTVPSLMINPANALGWYNVTGSPGHTETGGIGGADDRNAMDLNRANDADRGAAVFAVADGWVERNIGNGGWGGPGFGQLLLKHMNPDGTVYYTGYLHMTNITGLKATQGEYIRGGTQIGNVGNVSSLNPNLPYHLHFAVYEWDGTKLRSRSTTLVQKTERPNLAVVGNININNQVVNQSPFPVSRDRSFAMDVTVRNNGSVTMNGNFYLILTRDQSGSQYVGKISDAAMTANLGPGNQMNLRFTKSSFSSPAGTYFLQLYYDDGSGVGAALKRVSGTNPIAIRLESSTGRDARAVDDAYARAVRDSRFGSVVVGSFGTNLNWSPDWELRWLDFSFSGGRTVRIYHATYKTDASLRYTIFWDPDTGRWTNWVRA